MSSTPKPGKAIEVFYSYSHSDRGLRDRLETQLALLKREGLLSSWHGRKIGAGEEWAGQIDAHLNTAQIILLLISADFLASDYCYDIEMKRAMERHSKGEAQVIPVILRPCDWNNAPFGKLQALPTDGKAVTSRGWHNLDEAFFDVVKGIRKAIEDLSKNDEAVPQIKELRGLSRPAVDRERISGFRIQQVDDKVIDGVRKELEQLPWANQSRRLPTKAKRKLFFELRNLFLRKTFLQKVINCPDQNWGSRLRIACLTKELLWNYQASMKQCEAAVYPLYEHLLVEVDEYCSSLMGLFSLSEPYHTLDDLERYIHDTEEYKNHLPNRLLRPNIPLENMARCDKCLERIHELVEKLTAEYV